MVKDMTKGNPMRLILLFAIPLFIGNIFQQVYSMADTFIVGRTVGMSALAAVGATGSITFLILGFAHGLASGLAIPLAQKYGAKDFQSVSKSFGTSIIISIVVGVILTILSLFFCRTILEMMNTPNEIINESESYLRILFGGMLASMLYNLMSNSLRSIGDSRTPLYFLIAACIINIILDYIFIVYGNMGVSGAGVATIIAQVFSFVSCIIFIWLKVPILHLHRDSFKIDNDFFWLHVRIAFPMAFQMSIIAIGAITLQVALNGLGAPSVAAYTASGRIDQLATMPMMSFGVAIATYVAQNYGARFYDRIWMGVRECLKVSITFSVVIGLTLALFGEHFLRLFVGQNQEEVVQLGKWFFVTNSSIYFFLAMLLIYRYTIQGVGNSVTPTIAGIIELFMRMFAAVILAKHFGFVGATIANPLAWIGALIPIAYSYYRFKRQYTCHIKKET